MSYKSLIRHFVNSLSYVMLTAIAVGTTSCVHEWPEVGGVAREVTLHVNHTLEWTPAYELIVSRSDDPGYMVRYHHKICRAGSPDDIISEMQFHRRDITRADFTHKLVLPPGDYELWNWCDWADSNTGESLYFDSKDFSGIWYPDPYTGHNELRDALRGVTSFTVEENPDANYKIDVDLNLERPLAKYEIISTDLAEFIEKEVRSREGAPGDTPQDAPAGAKPNLPTLGQYKVKVIYTGYMPSVFNNYLNRPVDSKTGVSYEARIEPLNDNEAKICFDYVMVNGHESSIMAKVEIYNESDVLIGSSNQIEIPTKRNRMTIVRGKFLTSEAFGGVTIDPDFDGDYNIEII